MLNIGGRTGAKVFESCRARKMLSNAYLVFFRRRYSRERALQSFLILFSFNPPQEFNFHVYPSLSSFCQVRVPKICAENHRIEWERIAGEAPVPLVVHWEATDFIGQTEDPPKS